MDADGDGKASPYNSVDAIFSTARYLRASGAPGSYRHALYAYNHAGWYVDLVLRTARQFGKVAAPAPLRAPLSVTQAKLVQSLPAGG
jgi:membrane-bound lytic murein transglycosylase B